MKSPAFQFYPQDFLVGCADLTLEQVGAYIRLLCYQWAKGGLPNNPDQLSIMCGCHGNATALPLHKFRICDDGLLRNDRLESVRNEQIEYRHKQAKNAQSRWNKHDLNQKQENATALPTHMPNACSSPSPSSSNTNTEGSPSDMPHDAIKALEASKQSGIRKRTVGPLEFGFRSTWNKEFLSKFGCPYVPQGEKDNKCADKLLTHVPDIEEIMKITKYAWENPSDFHCEKAVTIAGLYSNYNQIREKMNRKKNHVQSRNIRPSYEDINHGK